METLRQLVMAARRVFSAGSSPRSGHKMMGNSFNFLTSAEMQQALEREILLSDRTGLPLTMVLFDLVEPENGPPHYARHLEQLTQVVIDSTRSTDWRGAYADPSGERVAVLLVHTSPVDAQRVVELIRKRFFETLRHKDGRAHPLPELTFDLFAYPESGSAGPLRRRPLNVMESPKVGPLEPPQNGGSQNGNGHAHQNGNGKSHDHDKAPQNGSLRITTLPKALTAHRGRPLAAEVKPVSVLLQRPMPLWKRMTDIAFALLAITLLSPLLALIALAVKLSSRGPVIFKQDRVGYMGRTFKCWKFRTMRVDYNVQEHKQYLQSLIQEASAGDGHERPMQKLDARNSAITWVGRILRSTHLDELAQLFNVLKGEMSLVGPRPCIGYEAEQYQQWCRQRFQAIPGITGLWQVNGKNKTTFRQMICLDIQYMRHNSLWLDLKIMLKTVMTIVEDVREALLNKKAEVQKDAQKA